MAPSRRWWILVLALLFGRAADSAAAREWTLYAGTYNRGGSPGITAYAFDDSSGRLRRLGLAAAATDASFMAWGPDERVLYAVDEEISHQDRDGSLVAWGHDSNDFHLRPLDRMGTRGRGTCYLAVSPQGDEVAIANYGSGSVLMVPLKTDGQLGPAESAIRFQGRGMDAVRQEAPHAHCATYDPSGKFLCCCDLGTDRVMIYRRDRGSRRSPVLESQLRLPPGSGPRHVAFSPSARLIYVISELSSTISVFDWIDGGRMMQTISALPSGAERRVGAAEIQVSPDGRFVYASNRSDDSLAVFRIKSGGRLETPSFCPSGGRTPRYFTLDPTGRFLLCANQGSGAIQVFSRDLLTGRLAPVSAVTDLGQPVFLLFSQH